MAIHGLAFFGLFYKIFINVGKLSKPVFIHSSGLRFFQEAKELVVRITIIMIIFLIKITPATTNGSF